MDLPGIPCGYDPDTNISDYSEEELDEKEEPEEKKDSNDTIPIHPAFINRLDLRSSIHLRNIPTRDKLCQHELVRGKRPRKVRTDIAPKLKSYVYHGVKIPCITTLVFANSIPTFAGIMYDKFIDINEGETVPEMFKETYYEMDKGRQILVDIITTTMKTVTELMMSINKVEPPKQSSTGNKNKKKKITRSQRKHQRENKGIFLDPRHGIYRCSDPKLILNTLINTICSKEYKDLIESVEDTFIYSFKAFHLSIIELIKQNSSKTITWYDKYAKREQLGTAAILRIVNNKISTDIMAVFQEVLKNDNLIGKDTDKILKEITVYINFYENMINDVCNFLSKDYTCECGENCLNESSEKKEEKEECDLDED